MWEENHFNQRGKQIWIDLAKSFNIDISEINFNYENKYFVKSLFVVVVGFPFHNGSIINICDKYLIIIN